MFSFLSCMSGKQGKDSKSTMDLSRNVVARCCPSEAIAQEYRVISDHSPFYLERKANPNLNSKQLQLIGDKKLDTYLQQARFMIQQDSLKSHTLTERLDSNVEKLIEFTASSLSPKSKHPLGKKKDLDRLNFLQDEESVIREIHTLKANIEDGDDKTCAQQKNLPLYEIPYLRFTTHRI